ncbi:unnamed protein product [Gongylonema pulchrum]|uniref:SHS2_Rpb7-N domain-containing protein n=1 Tax=Gongylonema pulchrum TaxID=637853 RepID=A0A183DCK9_9BILA|nr:unnamed protein product [Gongylonema pulchrum]
MFYHIPLEHEICLHPKYFGPDLLETVKRKLFNEVEGTCTGKYGFVVAVTTIDNIGAGLIQPGFFCHESCLLILLLVLYVGFLPIHLLNHSYYFHAITLSLLLSFSLFFFRISILQISYMSFQYMAGRRLLY